MTEDALVEKLKEMLVWGEQNGHKSAAAVLFGLIFDEDIRRWNDRGGVGTLVEKADSVLKTHVHYGRTLARYVSPNYDVLRRFR